MPKRSRKRDLQLSMPGPQAKSAKHTTAGKAGSPHKSAKSSDTAGEAGSPRTAAGKGKSPRKSAKSSNTAGKVKGLLGIGRMQRIYKMFSTLTEWECLLT